MFRQTLLDIQRVGDGYRDQHARACERDCPPVMGEGCGGSPSPCRPQRQRGHGKERDRKPEEAEKPGRDVREGVDSGLREPCSEHAMGTRWPRALVHVASGAGHCCARLSGSRSRRRAGLPRHPGPAGICASARRDPFPFRPRYDDQLGVYEGAPPWKRPCPDPVGPGAEHTPTDAPAEAHAVHPGAPRDAKAADPPAVRSDLEDDELDDRGPLEDEDKHRLPALLRTRARDPVPREMESVEACRTGFGLAGSTRARAGTRAVGARRTYATAAPVAASAAARRAWVRGWRTGRRERQHGRRRRQDWWRRRQDWWRRRQDRWRRRQRRQRHRRKRDRRERRKICPG